MIIMLFYWVYKYNVYDSYSTKGDRENRATIGAKFLYFTRIKY